MLAHLRADESGEEEEALHVCTTRSLCPK